MLTVELSTGNCLGLAEGPTGWHWLPCPALESGELYFFHTKQNPQISTTQHLI